MSQVQKYHPCYDKADRYQAAAEQVQDPALKRLLEQASATIAYLQKHRNGTQKLLAEINNEVVEALNDDGAWFDERSMEDFLPRMQAAIDGCDDEKHEFSTPYESWKHLAEEVAP